MRPQNSSKLKLFFLSASCILRVVRTVAHHFPMQHFYVKPIERWEKRTKNTLSKAYFFNISISKWKNYIINTTYTAGKPTPTTPSTFLHRHHIRKFNANKSSKYLGHASAALWHTVCLQSAHCNGGGGGGANGHR